MKLLVTGVNGQLGYDTARCLEKEGMEYRGAGREEFDLADEAAVKKYILAYRPDAVIHCAAYTAVDRAEEQEEQCYRVNVLGTRYIAQACRELDCKMLYVSTDYVFPGTGNGFYETGDGKGPLNVYGRTKLAGEEETAALLQRCFIVRTSWVFGSGGGNFVKTMLRLGRERDEISIVGDQIGSPTYTKDLAPLLCRMIRTEQYGVYHATNEGICSWAEFAEKIFEKAGLNTTVKKVRSEDYVSAARRPKNSRLSKKSLDNAGFERLPDWRDALERFIKDELKQNSQNNKQL